MDNNPYRINHYVVNDDAPLTDQLFGLVQAAVVFAQPRASIGTFYGGVTRIRLQFPFHPRNPERTIRIDAPGLQYADWSVIRGAVQFVRQSAVVEFYDGYFTVTA